MKREELADSLAKECLELFSDENKRVLYEKKLKQIVNKSIQTGKAEISQETIDQLFLLAKTVRQKTKSEYNWLCQICSKQHSTKELKLQLVARWVEKEENNTFMRNKNIITMCVACAKNSFENLNKNQFEKLGN